MKIGDRVIWNDDGQENLGVVESVGPSGRGTHAGNLYVVRFEDEEMETSYTRNFDDESINLGELKIAPPQKKEETPMPEPEEKETSILSIQADLKISNEEVIAIQVSKVEQQLLQMQFDTDEKIKVAKAEVKKLNKAVEDHAQTTGKALHATKIETVNAALKALGCTSRVSVRVENKIKDRTIEVVVSGPGGYNDKVTDTIPFGDEQKTQADKIDTLSVEVTGLTEEAVEVRKKLSQISTLERHAKAQLATAALEKSEDGQAFLAKLAGMKPNLPGLPVK